MNKTEIKHSPGPRRALLVTFCVLAAMPQMMAGPLGFARLFEASRFRQGIESSRVVENQNYGQQVPLGLVGDLAIEKDDGVNSVVAGDNLTYTLTVSNNGPTGLTGVTVSDILPAGLTFVSSVSGCTESNGTVTCPIGALAGDGGAMLSFVAAVDPGQTSDISNPATVMGNEADPDPGNNTSNHVTPVISEADLEITKDDGVTSIVPGNNLTYTLTVTNNGPSNSSGGAISDDLPTGLTFVSSASGCAELAGTVTCTFGFLADGANTVLTFVAAVDPGQTVQIDNTASVTGNETDPTDENDSANHLTPVASAEADLSIVKDDGVTSVVPGTNLTYNLTVTNDSPSNSSGGATSDDLPTGLTFVSSASGCTEMTGTVTCTFGSLADGANTVLTFVAAVDLGQTVQIDNTAAVTGNETDPTAGNDSSNHLTPVASAAADLSIVKDDGVTSVVPGTNLTYSLTVTNNGPSNSSGGAISDDLPTGLTFVSSASGCTEMTGTVTCTFGSLADGANTVLTFVAAIDPGQVDEIDNTATVTGNETDPISQNNSSSHTTEITPIETDLELVKDDGVDAAEPGTDLTYTLTITNHGPGASSGGSVRDPLPAELRFLTSSTGCIEIASIVNCPFERLAVGRSKDLEFTVHIEPAFADGFPALPADFLKNTATVDGNEVDPNQENNDADIETDLILVGDLNNDRVLDGRDASIMIQELSDRGPMGTVPQGNDAFDLNQDSLVDQDDLVFLAARLFRKSLPGAGNDIEEFILGVAEPPPSFLISLV